MANVNCSESMKTAVAAETWRKSVTLVQGQRTVQLATYDVGSMCCRPILKNFENFTGSGVWLRTWPGWSFSKPWFSMFINNCETWNIWFFNILNMKPICDLWCYCFSSCCIRVITWFKSQKSMNKSCPTTP